MSDDTPNPPNPERVPRNGDRGEQHNSSRGVTLVVGILLAIALVGGVMFFTGAPNERTDQAQLPSERTMTGPVATPAAPTLPPAIERNAPGAPGTPPPTPTR